MRRTPILALAAALAAAPALAESPLPEAADQSLGMALMAANVSEGGTLVGGAGALSAVRNALGNYNVAFVRDVSDCHHVASVSRNDNGTDFGIAVSSYVSSDPTVLRVRTFWPTAHLDDAFDRSFTVLVFCPK